MQSLFTNQLVEEIEKLGLRLMNRAQHRAARAREKLHRLDNVEGRVAI